MTYDEFDIETRIDNADHARKAAKEAILVGREVAEYQGHGALVHPETGEFLPATVENALQTRVAADRIIARCRDIKAAADDVLLSESERIGAKTMHLSGRTVTVTGDKETIWDVQGLVDGLLNEGLPPERVSDLVRTTIVEDVNAQVARQLGASNERYQRVIDGCKRVLPKRGRVTVK